jgi:hypothetical protein
MPRQKEVAFFNDDRNYKRGADWYFATVLADAPAGAVCGEASVAYMDGTPFGGLPDETIADLRSRLPSGQRLEDIVPDRIRNLLPDVKLICVLRDPVERAYSHYKMAVLDQAESRSYDEAIDQLMEPAALRQARESPTITNSYVVNGEYSRSLNGFLRVFGRKRILPLFSDELANRPSDVLKQVFNFIGVDDDFEPDNLHARYREAAVKRRIAGLDLYAWQRRIAGVRVAHSAWHALPQGMRRQMDRAVGVASFRAELWNARRRGATEPHEMSPSTRERLVEHFRQDGECLENLLGREPPWLIADCSTKELNGYTGRGSARLDAPR